MAKINSRKKGANAERKVAALMQKWSGREFSRTPASGGLRWKTSNVIGDIVCTEERHFFPFSIEVKVRKEINFEHLLYIDKSDILKFWNQALRDAKRGNKLPLLFMRYNGMPSDLWFVLIQIKVYRKLKKYFDTSFPLMMLSKKFVIMNSNTLLKGNYKKIRKKVIKIIDGK